MESKSYEYLSLGEDGPPWTSMSQASMARVMKAILLTNTTLCSSHVMTPQYAPRTSVLYSLKIPSDKVKEFEEICGYKTNYHPDMQLGMDIIKSAKRVIYDVGGKE